MSTRTKKQNRFYDSYIPRILKQHAPKNGITGNARQQLNSVLCLLTEIIAAKSRDLAVISNRRTVSDTEVMNAIKLSLPTALGNGAVEFAKQALGQFTTGEESKGTSRHVKAGLTLPPSVAEKYLRSFGSSKLMVTQNAPIALCAAIEHLAERIIILSAKQTSTKSKIRITVRDMYLAVHEDPELAELLREKNISFVGGGHMAFIHPMLKKKKNKRKKRKESDAPITRHRYKPGTVALRDIKKFQKVSDCLILAKAPFEKLIRSVLDECGSDATKISKQVFTILQYYLEDKLVETLSEANLVALHAGRIKVLPEDIDFIVSLRRKQKSIALSRLEQLHDKPLVDESDIVSGP